MATCRGRILGWAAYPCPGSAMCLLHDVLDCPESSCSEDKGDEAVDVFVHAALTHSEVCYHNFFVIQPHLGLWSERVAPLGNDDIVAVDDHICFMVTYSDLCTWQLDGHSLCECCWHGIPHPSCIVEWCMHGKMPGRHGHGHSAADLRFFFFILLCIFVVLTILWQCNVWSCLCGM